MSKTYISELDGRECGPAQIITELILINDAKKSNSVLPSKYWMQYPWSVRYKQQIVAANTLLKVYDPQAIINALRSKETKWITSLRVKKLQEYIQIEQDKLSVLQPTVDIKAIEVVKSNVNEYKESVAKKKTHASKLRD